VVAGFLVRNIIKGLLKLGANVRATMHQREPLIKDSKIEYLQCDLLSMDDCQKAVCDMEYVFMAAAFSYAFKASSVLPWASMI